MKNIVRVASLTATLICSLHPTLALATNWKLGAGVEVETQNIPVSGLAGVSADGDRRAAGTNMQTAAAGLNQIGNENQQKLDDASREISKKWTEAKSMPETSNEEKQAKQKRMDDLNKAEEELKRVREWNQETALNRAREMNLEGQKLIESAQDSAKPASSQVGLSNSDSGYAFTPQQGSSPIAQTSTGNAQEGTIRYFGNPAESNTGYAIYPDGSVYSYNGTPGSAELGTVNDATGSSAIGKITASEGGEFSEYTAYGNSPEVVSNAEMTKAAPVKKAASLSKVMSSPLLRTTSSSAPTCGMVWNVSKQRFVNGCTGQ